MDYVWKVKADNRISLGSCDPDWTAALEEDTANTRLAGLTAELSELQTLLYSAATHSVLVVLQGMDTSGKDGTIRHVFGPINPAGCHVTPFKAPTPNERAHDFLWRIHHHTPAQGMIGIFNRSHYEDVVTARVLKLAPGKLWKARYGHIRDFEELLSEHNTLIFKFFLHISKEEQEERLHARERDATKSWKLAVDDWENRALWDKYQKAYEDSFVETSTKRAPWFVVPANKKWYRNLAVAETLVSGLRKYRKEWLEVLEEQSRTRVAELQAWRLAHPIKEGKRAGENSDASRPGTKPPADVISPNPPEGDPSDS